MFSTCKHFIFVTSILMAVGHNCQAGSLGPSRAYNILGISVGASPEIINRNYLRVLRQIENQTNPSVAPSILAQARKEALEFERASFWERYLLVLNEDEGEISPPKLTSRPCRDFFQN